MKRILIMISSLLTLVLSVSCRREPMGSGSMEAPENLTPIRITMDGGLEYEMTTRADRESLNEGFGLFGYNTLGGAFNAASPSGLVFDNYRIVSEDGANWTYADEIAFWNPKSLDKYSFFAYYPYDAGQEGLELAIPAAGKVSECVDYMVTAPIIDQTSKEFVNLDFEHILSRISVSIGLSKHNIGQRYTLVSAKLEGVYDYSSYNLAAGAFNTESPNRHDIIVEGGDMNPNALSSVSDRIVMEPIYISPYSYKALGESMNLVLTFRYEFNAGSKPSISEEFTKTIRISEDFLGNKVYNLNINLLPDDPGIISMKMSVNDYSESEDKDIGIQHIRGTNLSEGGASNSYIVPSEGTYFFDASYKGNSTTEAVGDIASVEVLWESSVDAVAAKDLIPSVFFDDTTIGFYASSRKGNALIAAKDEGGNILWSWHIWMTDRPADQEYTTGYTVMDRNLGAVSALKTDGQKTYGLYYQWGRKDPFVGSDNTTGSKPADSKVTGSQTLAWSVLNPTVFSLVTIGQWFKIPGTAADPQDELWGELNSNIKTIYDPCPPGYMVGNSSAFPWGSSLNAAQDATNRGHDFSGQLTAADVSCWYPYAGYIEQGSAEHRSAGTYGYHWTGYGYNSSAYVLDPSTYRVYTNRTQNMGQGIPVRCIKEQQ